MKKFSVKNGIRQVYAHPSFVNIIVEEVQDDFTSEDSYDRGILTAKSAFELKHAINAWGFKPSARFIIPSMLEGLNLKCLGEKDYIRFFENKTDTSSLNARQKKRYDDTLFHLTGCF